VWLLAGSPLPDSQPYQNAILRFRDCAGIIVSYEPVGFGRAWPVHADGDGALAGLVPFLPPYAAPMTRRRAPLPEAAANPESEPVRLPSDLHCSLWRSHRKEQS
jgi:hypothetical protein